MIALVPHQTWSLDGPASSDQRDGLVQFWLHAPHDQLEALWSSGFGTVTRQLVQELTPQFVFTPQQVEQRNAIGEKLHQGGLDQPLAHQLMLASSRSSSRDDAQCLRIGINVEWPEAERRLHWFQHLKTQDMIWDIDPARVLLMKSLGLPAWWLDPHDLSNGWIDRPEATTLLSWVQHLGLGEIQCVH